MVAFVSSELFGNSYLSRSFMTKSGEDRNQRVTEALADIGAAVLSGAISTFLAVVVLLFSSSYVFEVLSKQFVLTVALGITHGLVLLRKYRKSSVLNKSPVFPNLQFASSPIAVLLSMFGPKPFTSAEKINFHPSEIKTAKDEQTERGQNAESNDDSNSEGN